MNNYNRSIVAALVGVLQVRSGLLFVTVLRRQLQRRSSQMSKMSHAARQIQTTLNRPQRNITKYSDSSQLRNYFSNRLSYAYLGSD